MMDGKNNQNVNNEDIIEYIRQSKGDMANQRDRINNSLNYNNQQKQFQEIYSDIIIAGYQTQNIKQSNYSWQKTKTEFFIVTCTNLSENKKYIVYRRFSHFEGLDEFLKQKYSKIFLPKLPQKHPYIQNQSNDTFLQNRQDELDIYLQLLCEYELVQYDQEFQNFMQQQDENYQPSKIEQKGYLTIFQEKLTQFWQAPKEHLMSTVNYYFNQSEVKNAYYKDKQCFYEICILFKTAELSHQQQEIVHKISKYLKDLVSDYNEEKQSLAKVLEGNEIQNNQNQQQTSLNKQKILSQINGMNKYLIKIIQKIQIALDIESKMTNNFESLKYIWDLREQKQIASKNQQEIDELSKQIDQREEDIINYSREYSKNISDIQKNVSENLISTFENIKQAQIALQSMYLE